MLVKVHDSYKYLEDFGLLEKDTVFLYDSGPIHKNKVNTSAVSHVNVLWMDRPIKIKCFVADSENKKREGLQKYSVLERNCGMYFPYVPYSSVSFFQGSVLYPLDVIFLKDEYISKIEKKTKVGALDVWSEQECSGVIEVNGGFCDLYDVKVGDRLVLLAVSEADLLEREQELNEKELSNKNDAFYYKNNVLHLISKIADNL
jgi:uncharacterized membrane protein (UPF0127 family)